MSYWPTVNEPVEFETCVDKYLSFRASVNESWRGGGWRVSQQLIESEPGFIVVMGDLGYRSARSRIKRPEKLREIQLRNLRKYTYKSWKIRKILFRIAVRVFGRVIKLINQAVSYSRCPITVNKLPLLSIPKNQIKKI